MATTKKIKAVKDSSAEEKIKEAARKLFTQKGFDAVKTRDIAEEAGINLALLNYYFRSKQKLFDIIMQENMEQFIQGIALKVGNPDTTMEEKIVKIVEAYIDRITANPHLPMFVLNELRGNPSKMLMKMDAVIAPMRANFMKQMEEAMKAGQLAPMHPFHFIANLVGLAVFPFVGRPLLQRVTGVNNSEFAALMEERKKLVPMWIRMMLTPAKK